MFKSFWITSRWTLISFLLGILIVHLFFSQHDWNNELFHVLLESGGSLLGFGLAFIIMAMIQKQQLTENHGWLIACFITMGTLDLFHSQTHPGQVFVWLHSSATFFGGIFAMLIWMPISVSKKLFKPGYFWLLFLASLTFSIGAIFWPELTPAMLDKSGKFTLSAGFLNVTGGVCFLFAWLYFAREYHRYQMSRSFYFSNHFSLFAVAGLLFEFSILWDGNWWFWHFMRALAYILLIFHFSAAYKKDLLTKIEQSNEIFEQSLNEIYMFDRKTLYFAGVNRGARENLGYSMAELANMTPLDLLQGFNREEFRNLLSPLESGARKNIVFTTAVERKDGSCYPAEINLQFSKEGPGIYFAFSVDITERQAVEEERLRLQNELQQAQKMESLGHLTGGIAHDFNNLLGVINGYSSLAMEKYDKHGDKTLLEFLNQINTAGERAAHLVRQMLAFSRGDNYNAKPVSLPKILQEDIQLLRSSLPASIDINWHIDPALPPITVDTTQLHQLMMNLAVNARDAMNGTGKLSIKAYFQKNLRGTSIAHKSVRGDWVVLSVTDTGSGIKPEIVKKIFDPFFTTKEVGKGTGMGLSVVYRIMDTLNGHILLDSKTGVGTTFQLLFAPVTAQNDVDLGHKKTKQAIPRGNGCEILVVDDELMLAEHISHLLEIYNYKPQPVFESTKALDLFKQDPERFSMLITDQTMPKMTGIELAQKLRQVRANLPVIMCSGYSDQIDAKSAREQDIYYFSKPVDTVELLNKISECLKTN